MLTILRINNIIADRAAPELTAKLGGSFQEVRRYLGKRAVVFYEHHSFPAQFLNVTYFSLVIVLFLGALLTLTRFNGENVRVDHVVIQAVQRAVRLIGIMMPVIALACGYLFITVRTKHFIRPSISKSLFR